MVQGIRFMIKSFWFRVKGSGWEFGVEDVE